MAFRYLAVLAILVGMGASRSLEAGRNTFRDAHTAQLVNVNQHINDQEKSNIIEDGGAVQPNWQAQFAIGRACISHDDCPEACYTSRKRPTCGPWLY